MRVRQLFLGMFLAIAGMAFAQQGQFATTKITDNVYVFRYMFHQALFVVTPEGVIVTDPISVEAAKVYLEEIRKITQAPIRYVIYSHHHADHITGGAAFQGATFVAHKLGKERLEKDKPANIVIPTEAVDDKRTITMGGTTLELIYTGRNHSDNSLVMLLPKEKILFAVDFIPVQALPFRDLPDFYINEWVDSMKKVQALDFTTFIPGHLPTSGTKQDIANMITYVTELMAAAKKAHGENKCNVQEVKMTKYEKWANYEQYLPLNVGRMCKWAATGE